MKDQKQKLLSEKISQNFKKHLKIIIIVSCSIGAAIIMGGVIAIAVTATGNSLKGII